MFLSAARIPTKLIRLLTHETLPTELTLFLAITHGQNRKKFQELKKISRHFNGRVKTVPENRTQLSTTQASKEFQQPRN
jgi:ABC-type transport system involved in cytochrome bd biosynthesis fused ATPase/permease subunit